MRHELALVSTICVALILGCTGIEPPPDEDGVLTSDRIPIAGWNPRDAPDEDAFDHTTESIAGAVASQIRLVDGNRKVFCSATLIGRRVLLTAAHCGPDVDFVEFAQNGTKSYKVKHRTVHPRWNVLDERYDLALLWLETPVAPEIVRKTPKLFLGSIERKLQEGLGYRV